MIEYIAVVLFFVGMIIGFVGVSVYGVMTVENNQRRIKDAIKNAK